MDRSKRAVDGTNRFADRVADYLRFRPSYPVQIVNDLVDEERLSPDQLVADIGSGTGLLARLFLSAGCRVCGVEPNREMRIAGEVELGRLRRFTSVDGSAEATGLPDGSVDWIVAGQAFHWFDRTRTRIEFGRILAPDGAVALVWNDRQYGTTRFLRGYEELLQEFGTDYRQVNHRNLKDDLFVDFFGPGNYEVRSYPNRQKMDYRGLEGRLLSSSYTPGSGDPAREKMLERLQHLFRETSRDNRVEILYDTRVWIGRFGK